MSEKTAHRDRLAAAQGIDMERLQRQQHPATPAGPASGPIALTTVEAAYVTMVEGEYRQALAMAQQIRATRFAVIMKAHGIVDGSNISIPPTEDGQPMQLVVTPPASPNGNGANGATS